MFEVILACNLFGKISYNTNVCIAVQCTRICYILNYKKITVMDTTKIPKFQEDRNDEQKLGHDKNE